MAPEIKSTISDALGRLPEDNARIEAIAKQAKKDLKSLWTVRRAHAKTVLQTAAADKAAIELRVKGLTKRLSGRLGKMDLGLDELLVPYTSLELQPAALTSRVTEKVTIAKKVLEDGDEHGRTQLPTTVVQSIEKATDVVVYEAADPNLAEEWPGCNWQWAKQPESMMASIPCIVKHPNLKFYVLACPVCDGNSTRDGAYLKGAKAFYDHLLQAHGSRICKGTGVAATIQRCQVRRLTAVEVEDLASGSPDALEIEKVPVKRGLTDEAQKLYRKRKADTSIGVDVSHTHATHARSEKGSLTGNEVEARRPDQASDDGSGGVPIQPQAKRSKKGSHYLHDWLSAGWKHAEDEDEDVDDEVALGLQHMGMAAVTAEVQGSMPGRDARTVNVPVRQLDERYDSESDGA
ncbi:hypothetical protein LTR53_004103 [Teratosphaeriaceae sp. CCFEE 6253]|nr:hypothetical protein LTR53_004103 [Teratosphaeriaceae sp. CCFEE 6253]